MVHGFTYISYIVVKTTHALGGAKFVHALGGWKLAGHTARAGLGKKLAGHAGRVAAQPPGGIKPDGSSARKITNLT